MTIRHTEWNIIIPVIQHHWQPVPKLSDLYDAKYLNETDKCAHLALWLYLNTQIWKDTSDREISRDGVFLPFVFIRHQHPTVLFKHLAAVRLSFVFESGFKRWSFINSLVKSELQAITGVNYYFLFREPLFSWYLILTIWNLTNRLCNIILSVY